MLGVVRRVSNNLDFRISRGWICCRLVEVSDAAFTRERAIAWAGCNRVAEAPVPLDRSTSSQR